MKFVDLWRWNGHVDRKTYASVGIIGFVLKHLLDGLLTRHFLHNNDGFWFNYWAPLGVAVRLSKLSSYQTEYLAAMLLAAMPFIWLGIAMTTQRLRDAGKPLWLAVIFFVPVANVVFLAALCFLPSARVPLMQEAGPPPTGQRAFDGIIPQSQVGSALLAILLTTVVGLAFLLLGTVALQTYGWGLFVALPFCMGLLSSVLYGYHQPRGFGESIGVALLPIAILGIALLLGAMEGLICILMAAPLACGLAALGGMLGYTIQTSRWISKNPAMLSMILLFLPGAFGVERIVQKETPKFVVRSAVEINAPPEQVWREVVAFAEIPPPQEVVFRAGIAYPIRAEISGKGPGAIRRCVFSTGAFLEPIEVWDEPRLLRFGVTASPAPLNEMTPYGHIETRHLHGYFSSEEGQFSLTPRPGGRTRLEGTTWYRNTMWPSAYWSLWSNYIIHRIHLRVLEHIKKETEGAAAPVH